MDDLIILLLTIIIIVAGSLSQMKKKRPLQPTDTQPKKPGNFWDLLDQEMEFPVEQPQQTVEVITETEKTKIPVKPIISESEATNEGESIFKINVFEEPDKKAEPAKINEEKFSLRKAVIYSEILNRKYT